MIMTVLWESARACGEKLNWTEKSFKTIEITTAFCREKPLCMSCKIVLKNTVKQENQEWEKGGRKGEDVV